MEVSKNNIIVHTDGSFSSKTKKGGYAFVCDYYCYKEDIMNRRLVYKNGDFYNGFMEIGLDINDYKPTSQVMELLAVCVSLTVIQNQIKKEEKIKSIIIYTDSNYIVKTFKEWIYNWVKNKWKKYDNKKIKNVELIRYIWDIKNYIEYNNISLDIEYIKAHSDNKYNNICDSLAKEFSMC